MIEANHPNACNLCHVDQPIDWTLKYLKDWYQADRFSAARIAKNYPDREKPAAVGWLTSPNYGTRLVAAEALIRADAHWAVPELLEILDDPFLVNRQFTAYGLGKMLDMDPCDHGYRFYMFKKERAKSLLRLRTLLTAESAAVKKET